MTFFYCSTLHPKPPRKQTLDSLDPNPKPAPQTLALNYKAQTPKHFLPATGVLVAVTLDYPEDLLGGVNSQGIGMLSCLRKGFGTMFA